MKVLTVVGARPQFVKAAVVSRAFVDHRPDVHECIVHTGQHFDVSMSDVFFEELAIPRPALNLGLGGGTHGQNTGRMIESLEGVMLDHKPDWVLVYGDTDSTLAGALAAAKLHIPVAHVESGLRSFNRHMPEEINRILTDHIAGALFAPTETAVKNLEKEGVSNSITYLVGDVMYDATLHYKATAREPEWFAATGFTRGYYVLATVHRAENTNDAYRLGAIFRGLAESGLNVILPLHPRTRGLLENMPIELPARVQLVDPVGYLEMVWLEANCLVVATDSGGMQKEAYFHGKPCVTFRTETEWVELVEHGWNRLVSPDCAESIATAVRDAVGRHGVLNALYGEGNAGEKLVSHLS